MAPEKLRPIDGPEVRPSSSLICFSPNLKPVSQPPERQSFAAESIDQPGWRGERDQTCQRWSLNNLEILNSQLAFGHPTAPIVPCPAR